MGAKEWIKDLLINGSTENANKDSSLISTKKELSAGMIGGEIYLESLPVDIAAAHRSGDIYIHDTGDRVYNSINCCLFDMSNLLDGGFEVNGIKCTEPTSVESALRVIADVILHASSQQYGGFTIPEIDTVLAKYVRIGIKRSEEYYSKHIPELPHYRVHELAVAYVSRSLEQGFQAIETRQNTISNANGQTTFLTFTFGMDETPEGRLVTKILLENRKKGLGKNGATPIFPKLVFLRRKGINDDLYCQAIDCSLSKMYPDYESVQAGYIGEMYEKYGKFPSPMGCRAYLSPYFNEDGEIVFTGRANCGAITLNTVRYAIEAKGDKDKYFELMDKNFELALRVHLITYDRLKDVKAKTNPLFFCEGGCHIKLDPEDTIEEAIKTFTWSFGYIGLDEASKLMTGKQIHEDNSFAIEVLQHLDKLVQKAKKDHNLLFAIYGTPAESLCFSLRNKDFKKYGLIEGATDKEYYTNSFHVDVRAKINPLDKQDIELPMFNISTGGRITYNEYPRTTNLEGVKAIVDHGIDNGQYVGINMELDQCNSCGAKGEFKNHVCDHCGSDDIVYVNRVCGYLGYEHRMNKGKIEEKSFRRDHFELEV